MQLRHRAPHGLAVIALLAGTAGLIPALAEDAVPGLALSSPRDYQVFQRATPAAGKIAVAGTLLDEAKGGDWIEARIIGGGLPGAWRKLAVIVPGQTGFRAELPAPAGGWRSVEVRLGRTDTTLAQVTVPHVGMGELFVVAGQSNSANYGEDKQRTQSRLVSTFSGTDWRLAHDPQPGAGGGSGSFMPPFGDAMVQKFGVPVGIIAVGAGGTSVREWLPRGARFPNPPTVTGNVTALSNRQWESNGGLYENLTRRLNQLGRHGFRALLWHQGESDAHQADPSRTLAGELYTAYLEQFLREARRDSGWEFPCFVAQATYHTPDDPGSPDIREAQRAVWTSGAALQGPDTDSLNGDLRQDGGKGVHFSGPGLREHARLWVEKVGPWLERQLAAPDSTPEKHPWSGRLVLPGENLMVEGRPAFVFLSPANKRSSPQPWILYAPTLPPYPDEAERWMHQQFLADGVAVAGVDVGEAYGSPSGRAVYQAFYEELTKRHGFAPKPCVLGRSRGGLLVTSWAAANTNSVSGLAGIYPVFDFRTYPGLTNAAPAYGLAPSELATRAEEFNPIQNVDHLARAGVPAFLIHGDSDQVVPLRENSLEFVRRYHEAGAGPLASLIVIAGQGHNMFEDFFHSRELVDFAIQRARSGTAP